MQTWHRMVIILSSLVMLALAVFFFGLLMGQDPVNLTPVVTVDEAMNLYKFIGFTIFFIFFLLLATAGLSTKKPLRTIIHDTDLGEVRIAFTAVEDLALRAVDKIRGVKEAQVTVEADSNGLSFNVEIVSNPDLSIPQLTMDIRNKLAEYITETVGIPVVNSTVTVTRITSESRARVE